MSETSGLTIRVKLDAEELAALQRAAAWDLRSPPEQARYIIRKELLRHSHIAAGLRDAGLTDEATIDRLTEAVVKRLGEG